MQHSNDNPVIKAGPPADGVNPPPNARWTTAETLRLVAAGTASATGGEFFRSLVRSLAEVWDVSYAFVSEYSQGQETARMVAFYKRGEIHESVEYELYGTPCAAVIADGEAKYYPRSVRELFPADNDAKVAGIESYVAIPIYDDDGIVVGHIGVFDTKPMPDEPPDLSIFQIFGARFRAEQKRIRAEKELESAHAQLVESEKMAVIGQLTSGILHEINTPVGVVRSNLDVIERCVDRLETGLATPADSPALANADRMIETLEVLRRNAHLSRDASDRIVGLAERLQRFTRLDESEQQLTDLNDCLESVLALLEAAFADGVRLERQLSELPPIAAHTGELNQALLALLTNAIEAIEDSGTIIVRSWPEEEALFVQIADDGRGMTAAELQSVFDIRIRSKGERVGMGMAMAGVRSVVEHHGGHVSVESEEGQGTKVTIRLPRD